MPSSVDAAVGIVVIVASVVAAAVVADWLSIPVVVEVDVAVAAVDHCSNCCYCWYLYFDYCCYCQLNWWDRMTAKSVNNLVQQPSIVNLGRGERERRELVREFYFIINKNKKSHFFTNFN